MKDRLIGFIKTYCLFVCIFVLQKPLFMLFYKSLYPDASCADWFSVAWHGLPLDLSLAGYLSAATAADRSLTFMSLLSEQNTP